uniref:Alpha carbonic anhydrase 9 n=1 Tax=Stylophora pistillata TaxID=50429 RepID=A0A1B0Y993_STYPI|nr:alpha carbonic anhydrase 9 [Stylophora pistillata]
MDCLIVAVLAVVFNNAFADEGGRQWGYKETEFGPADWGLAVPSCSGQFQSPIDIVTSLSQSNSSYGGLVPIFDNEDGTVSGVLSNNGHALTVTLDKTKGGLTLTAGPLGQNTFRLEQFRFHFGCESNVGSEHTVDGNSFASEMHLRFYNDIYGNFKDAVSKPDGLLVIGVFLQVNGGFNKWMENIALASTNVVTPNGDSYSLDGSVPLTQLVPDLMSKSAPYYTYKGSLTTPPCYESVQWILMKNPIPVTESQLELLRSLSSTSGDSLCNNFRPVKPLNGRKIFKWPGKEKLSGLLNVPFFH